jgi:hypothetical protein
LPLLGPANVHKTDAAAVEKLITSVHEGDGFVDRAVDKKIVGFSFPDSVAGHPGRL